MRKAFFEGIEDGLEYSFGPDVTIICEIMHYPGVQGDGLNFDVRVTGAQLIEFIRSSAPGHVAIIEQIKPENHYDLTGWDW